MGHAVNGHCLQIARDAINRMGGPGIHVPDGGKVGSDALDPPPLETDDPRAAEILSMAMAESYAEAVAAIEAARKDTAIPYSSRGKIKKLGDALEKWAKKEIPRLSDLVAKAIKKEKFPDGAVVARLKSLVAAYETESWMKSKDYLKPVREAESDDYAPAVRERVREKLVRDALAAEFGCGIRDEEKRNAAKALYESAAAKASEDGGVSVWPSAAKYRLSWWVS
jgi:hypothetical protein